MSLCRTIREYLRMHLYKMQIVQKLEPGNHEQDMIFCETTVTNIVDENFDIANIIFSDKVHFDLFTECKQTDCLLLFGNESKGHNGETIKLSIQSRRGPENLFFHKLSLNLGKMTNQRRRELCENCKRDSKIFSRTWKRIKI